MGPIYFTNYIRWWQPRYLLKHAVRCCPRDRRLFLQRARQKLRWVPEITVLKQWCLATSDTQVPHYNAVQKH